MSWRAKSSSYRENVASARRVFRGRRRRQNCSEEGRQVERVRARRRRENYSEERRQAERDS